MLCKENIDDNPDPTVNKIGVPTHLQLLDLAPIKILDYLPKKL